MLAFIFHINLSLALVALSLGAAIIIWSKMQENVGTSFAKLIGYVVVILSLTSLLCIGYGALKYWYSGAYGKSWPMMTQCPMISGQMMGGKSMPNQTMQQPMMSGQMMGGTAKPSQMVQQPVASEQTTSEKPAPAPSPMMQIQPIPEPEQTVDNQPDMNQTSQSSSMEMQNQ